MTRFSEYSRHILCLVLVALAPAYAIAADFAVSGEYRYRRHNPLDAVRPEQGDSKEYIGHYTVQLSGDRYGIGISFVGSGDVTKALLLTDGIDTFVSRYIILPALGITAEKEDFHAQFEHSRVPQQLIVPHESAVLWLAALIANDSYYKDATEVRQDDIPGFLKEFGRMNENGTIRPLITRVPRGPVTIKFWLVNGDNKQGSETSFQEDESHFNVSQLTISGDGDGSMDEVSYIVYTSISVSNPHPERVNAEVAGKRVRHLKNGSAVLIVPTITFSYRQSPEYNNSGGDITLKSAYDTSDSTPVFVEDRRTDVPVFYQLQASTPVGFRQASGARAGGGPHSPEATPR